MSEFEGEFLAKENALRSACEHDGKDQGRRIPCMDDMQKIFIAKLSPDVKSEAHVMLSERRADFMVNANLAYSNCRFEDLLPEHFMKLMMVTEDIMLKREASKDANLGSPEQKGQYQGRDLHLPGGNGTKWQRREQTREVRTNATVANASGIEELQVYVGQYQNSTKLFTQKNKVWCAPVREFATWMCENCNTQHYITLCVMWATHAKQCYPPNDILCVLRTWRTTWRQKPSDASPSGSRGVQEAYQRSRRPKRL